MLAGYKVICSHMAAAELKEAECTDTITAILYAAQEKDRGVHEGLVFNFDMHGKEWSAVVDIGERWVKIFSAQELDKIVREAVQGN